MNKKLNTKESEQVNHPSHYNKGSVECIDIIENWPFNIASAVKYLWRYMDKGNPVQDLNKAVWYLQREIYNLNTKGGYFVYNSHDEKYDITKLMSHIKSLHIRDAISQVWGNDFKGVYQINILGAMDSIKFEIEELSS